MFTHKKICTSIVGLVSPTFGVQIKTSNFLTALCIPREYFYNIALLTYNSKPNYYDTQSVRRIYMIGKNLYNHCSNISST